DQQLLHTILPDPGRCCALCAPVPAQLTFRLGNTLPYSALPIKRQGFCLLRVAMRIRATVLMRLRNQRIQYWAICELAHYHQKHFAQEPGNRVAQLTMFSQYVVYIASHTFFLGVQLTCHPTHIASSVLHNYLTWYAHNFLPPWHINITLSTKILHSPT